MNSTLHAMVLLLAVYAGLYAAVFTIARLTSDRLVNGEYVCFVHYRAALPRWLDTTGVTVFGVVWLPANGVAADVLAHEYRHTMQERRYLYLGYLPMILIAFAIGGGHDGSWLEEDARTWGAAHEREFVGVLRVSV